MSSGLTEFLDWTGPVQKDTTFTDSGKRWNNTSPVGEIGKTTVSIVIPSVPLTNLGFLANGICVQFNYTAPQSFSLLDWNSVINEAAYNSIGLFFAIRYRIGNVAVRYRLTGDLTIIPPPNIGGSNCIPAPLYSGQLIKPNFVIEAWKNIFGGFNFDIPFPINLQTSILNAPSPFLDGGTLLSPVISGIQTSNLFVTLPVAMPAQFDQSGPWLSN